MSASNNEPKQVYRIATNISSGKVKDPVTGEAHDIEPTSDTSGEIEVTDPYAARTLVKESNGFEFVNNGPADHDVMRAQQSALGIESVPDHVIEFAEGFGKTIGSQTLAAAEGYDPEEDTANNDPKLKVTKTYEDLREAGHRSEATYLRLLGDLNRQEQFVTHVRERGMVDR